MAESVFRRFPADDLIWDSPDADESDGGPLFFPDAPGQSGWEIGEDFWEAPSQLAGITGEAALTLGAVTLDAQGVVPVIGQAAIVLDPMTATGEGALPIVGAAEIVLGPVMLTAKMVTDQGGQQTVFIPRPMRRRRMRQEDAEYAAHMAVEDVEMAVLDA
jgi:hypothetical protein